MVDLFKKGNKITINGRNCFLILDVNESDIACKDLLTDDFDVFSKTEHNFELFDPKKVIPLCVDEMMDDETKVSTVDKKAISEHISLLLNKWID